jgi:sn1-specific diacylglycerol lipase
LPFFIYSSFQVVSAQPGCYAHAGMIDAAVGLRDDLDRRKVLSEFFEQYPGYQLVVCGHSLGASVATLLSVLYQKSML